MREALLEERQGQIDRNRTRAEAAGAQIEDADFEQQSLAMHFSPDHMRTQRELELNLGKAPTPQRDMRRKTPFGLHAHLLGQTVRQVRGSTRICLPCEPLC